MAAGHCCRSHGGPHAHRTIDVGPRTAYVLYGMGEDKAQEEKEPNVWVVIPPPTLSLDSVEPQVGGVGLTWLRANSYVS